MLVYALVVALVVVVAVGILAWSRSRRALPAAKATAGLAECPDCGTRFIPKTDTKCSGCGRSLVGLSPSMRRLPSTTDDEDDDPMARTVVKSGRVKTQCQKCGAALEGNTECPKCGARQA